MEHFEEILAEAKKHGNIVVIDFSATWCGPCKAIAPIYEQMAGSAEYSNVVFLKVDVDDVAEIAHKYDVMSMPTFVFLKKSAVVERFSGASVQKLTQTLNSLL